MGMRTSICALGCCRITTHHNGTEVSRNYSEKKGKTEQTSVAQSSDQTEIRTRVTSFEDYRYTAGTQNQTPVLRKGEMPDSMTRHNSIYNHGKADTIANSRHSAKTNVGAPKHRGYNHHLLVTLLLALQVCACTCDTHVKHMTQSSSSTTNWETCRGDKMKNTRKYLAQMATAVEWIKQHT